MVLKDGQIIEQGSHQELLARGGVFATMWADQISATGDPTIDLSAKGDLILGYQTESTPAAEATAEDMPGGPLEHVASGVFVDTPEAIPATLASTEDAIPPPPPAKDVALPFDSTAVPTPLAFPRSEDAASQKATSERIPSQTVGGVTFGDGVNSPPSRSGTPDPDTEMKRKRTTSQNFQRFARKISLTTRRTGAGVGIPGLKRESPFTPQVGAGEGSARDSTDSATASVQSDIGKAKSKKDKKEKRKSLF